MSPFLETLSGWTYLQEASFRDSTSRNIDAAGAFWGENPVEVESIYILYLFWMIRKRGEPMIGREYLFLLVCFMPFFRPTVHCLVPLWAILFLRLPGLTLQMSTNLLASTKATIVRSELLCLLYPSLPKARILRVPAAYISVDCQHKCQSFNYWSSLNCFLYYIIYIYIYVCMIVRM